VDAHKLVKMVNEISAFFEGGGSSAADPGKDAALDAVANHLKRFWDPRMRREIVRWVDEHDGEGLGQTALLAIRTHRDKLLPQEAAPR
jgi:formate dehydrogenase subunit delta